MYEKEIIDVLHEKGMECINLFSIVNEWPDAAFIFPEEVNNINILHKICVNHLNRAFFSEEKLAINLSACNFYIRTNVLSKDFDYFIVPLRETDAEYEVNKLKEKMNMTVEEIRRLPIEHDFSHGAAVTLSKIKNAIVLTDNVSSWKRDEGGWCITFNDCKVVVPNTSIAFSLKGDN